MGTFHHDSDRAEQPRLLAILVTMTTYGTWLRGDERGWVDDGIIHPADPDLQRVDCQRLKHPPFLFPPDQLHNVGAAMGKSLTDRLDATILAMTVQTWHTHFVVAASHNSIPDIVKCAKDAARYHLRPGRPIWTDGYDKRFCFDDQTVINRIDYVERHNTAHNLLAKPWPFITNWKT